MCTQILEYDNFLSGIVFIDETKFHIFGFGILPVSSGAVRLPENIKILMR
jgi:hypothetical protein